MRRASLIIACSMALGAATARAESGEDSFVIKTQEEVATKAARTEIAGYAQLAKEAADREKWPLAEHFVNLLANVDAPPAAKKGALIEMAGTYEAGRDFAKAIAIYEKAIELFERDPDAPELIFKVGLLYREVGAHARAISRFYSVLNSALKLNERDMAAYRSLTMRAQKEIAQTHFQAGNYAQAAKFNNLLLRTDLPAEQRATVSFQAIHCQHLLDDAAGAVVAAGKFLEEFADHESAPECRYILASALRSLGRKREAFDAVVALLREENARKEKAPERWTYWQKKTGNDFANTYYQQGDFSSALTIYQTLAGISTEPDWQWPALYQIGLCFERLRLVTRAAEAYKYIIEDSEKPERKAKPLPESTANIVKMARWRGEQLAWQHSADTTLQHVLGEPLADAEPLAIESQKAASNRP
jgi:tetratricopeptide (TPR) repeat protein